ncbi:MAG: tRNA epoxyqueuosine(34) reductase QueG [Lacipirellulaceae bacterium]
MPTPDDLARLAKAEALARGFDLVGVAPAERPAGLADFDEWLRRGYAGQMGFLAERRDAYEHPDRLLPGTRSVVIVGLGYRTGEPREPSPSEGRVARFAWGDADYHAVVRAKLYRLADALREHAPGSETRCAIDSAPLFERELAERAGLGWIGKNTLLLNREQGSWFFLAAVLTTAELAPDEPQAVDHCGTCTACLDACPTRAFVAPRVLDASKCISYLTIEHEGLPAEGLRAGIGDWAFGCDVCQDVCPWNRRAPTVETEGLTPRDDTDPIDLVELVNLTDDEHRRRFRKTPLWRPRHEGLARNAAIALGNKRPPEGEAALRKARESDSPTVRAAAEWGLAQYEANREAND